MKDNPQGINIRFEFTITSLQEQPLFLQESLTSEAAFNNVRDNILGGFIGGGLVFVALAGLIYHFIVGTKHLIQDFGIGESLQGGRNFAWAALAASGFFIALAFLWMVL